MIPADNSKRVDQFKNIDVSFIDICLIIAFEDILDDANELRC